MVLLTSLSTTTMNIISLSATRMVNFFLTSMAKLTSWRISCHTSWMADLGISPLEIKDRHLLEEGCFLGRVETTRMQTSAQLNCWSLIYLKPVTRLFFNFTTLARLGFFMLSMSIIVSKSVAAFNLGGGKFNTYHVMSFCTKLARKRNISQLKVTVIKSHYKHAALVKYYKRYGFQMSKDRDQFVDLILPMASDRISSSWP